MELPKEEGTNLYILKPWTLQLPNVKIQFPPQKVNM